jgi:hypothetical protein
VYRAKNIPIVMFRNGIEGLGSWFTFLFPRRAKWQGILLPRPRYKVYLCIDTRVGSTRAPPEVYRKLTSQVGDHRISRILPGQKQVHGRPSGSHIYGGVLFYERLTAGIPYIYFLSLTRPV